MKEIKDIDELRSIQLEALKDVHKFCEENNLRYFLAYGTLIGAIRHKGYIPWDDDIDILMPRPDYERFLKTYNNEIYEALSYKKNKQYPYPYGKVFDKRTVLKEYSSFDLNFGVYIDVFPLDGVPENPQKAKVICEKIHILNNIMNLKKNKVKGIKRSFKKQIMFIILQCIVCFIPYRWVIKKTDKLCSTETYESSKQHVGCFMDGEYFRLHSKEACKNLILSEFENNQFYIPQGYDEILTNNYGNYMQLPPEKERISTHTFKAWWK